MSAAFSPIMNTDACRLPLTTDGMIDASSWAARVTLGWRFR